MSGALASELTLPTLCGHRAGSKADALRVLGSGRLTLGAEQSWVQRDVRFYCFVPQLSLLFLERVLLPDTG